ncbi:MULTISPECIES: TIGR04076 family protein [unclassified Desulfovibrio]|uniref:TIGR04076 family protein n=1 Tax=unclassified Desulfovibrio TaxID=2593640 RepID=UPI0013EDB2D4|nr:MULTISPECIES: TIGR04076 family protein [unclassified Desulfovibrio]
MDKKGCNGATRRHPLKMTVVKLTRAAEMFPELPEGCIENFEPVCPRFKLGQTFHIDENGNCREDFPCAWAWNDNYAVITTMQAGGHFCQKRAGVQYTCCTDGLRPVVFKVEWFDDKDLPATEAKEGK